MRTYLAGKTKINWKKNTWKVMNRHNWVPISLYTSFVSEFWDKYAKQLHSTQIYKLKVIYFFTILLYIPSAKQYYEWRMKWVTAMSTKKWSAKKLNNKNMSCSFCNWWAIVIFKNMNFSYKFFFLLTKTCVKS